MNNIFNMFQGSFGMFGNANKKYNPLINYDWSTTTAKEYKTDGVELVDLSVAVNGTGINTTGTTIIYSDSPYPQASRFLNVLEKNTLYKIVFTINSISSGGISVIASGVNILNNVSSTKEYVLYETPTVDGSLDFRSGNGSEVCSAILSNISLQKVIQEPNKRYLKDVGSTPTYNASMYFGRGAYLNGVDQAINVSSIVLDNNNTHTYIMRTSPTKTTSIFRDIILSCSNFYLYMNVGTNGITLRYNNTSATWKTLTYSTTISILSFALTVNKDGFSLVNIKDNTVLLSATDGVYTTTRTLEIANLNSTNYYNGILKDIFIFNRAITTAEKDSYINTPELFYAMAQADNTCVLNMPMCETDGYVRNMKGYSEGSDIAPSLTYINSIDGTGNTATNIANIQSVHLEVPTTVSYRPYFRTNITFDTNINYVLSWKIKVTSGTMYLNRLEYSPYNGGDSTLTIGKTYGVGEYEFIAIGRGRSNGEITLTSDGTSYYNTNYTIEFSAKQITAGIYPITNYTSSVRDNAKNLQYGLQTCKFVRDSLGVIQSASDYLECDGVGYVDTGWIPSADEDWAIELIMDFDGNNTGEQWFLGQDISWSQSRMAIGKKDYRRSVFWIGQSSISSTYLSPDSKHILTSTYNGITKTAECFIDGISIGSITNTSFVGSSNSFLISLLAFPVKSFIDLFKVHNKVLTQEEVTANYNKAVAEGLLS